MCLSWLCLLPCLKDRIPSCCSTLARVLGWGVVCSLCKSWYLAHVRQTVPEMVSASLSGWTPSLTWNPLKAVWGWRRRGEISRVPGSRLGSVPGSVEPLFPCGPRCECRVEDSSLPGPLLSSSCPLLPHGCVQSDEMRDRKPWWPSGGCGWGPVGLVFAVRFSWV